MMTVARLPRQLASASRPLFASTSSAVRTFSSSPNARAAPAPEAAASSSSAPPPAAAASSPKISAIVDQISTLTLLEAADLVEALKTKLNIVDIAMPSSAPAAAAPAAAEAAPAAEAPKAKTVFNVQLTAIDAAQKAKAIREVKAIMPSMNLVEAKKFVESLPQTLKEGATKEEAEKLQKALEAVGAKVTLE